MNGDIIREYFELMYVKDPKCFAETVRLVGLEIEPIKVESISDTIEMKKHIDIVMDKIYEPFKEKNISIDGYINNLLSNTGISSDLLNSLRFEAKILYVSQNSNNFKLTNEEHRFKHHLEIIGDLISKYLENTERMEVKDIIQQQIDIIKQHTKEKKPTDSETITTDSETIREIRSGSNLYNILLVVAILAVLGLGSYFLGRFFYKLLFK